MNEYDENNIDWYEEEIVNEAEKIKRKDAIHDIEGALNNGFAHMLKYKYDQTKQSDSWYRTINNSNRMIFDTLKKAGKGLSNVLKEIDDDFLDKCYKEGIKIAIKDGKGRYDESTFPPRRYRNEFNFDSLKDVKRKNEFLERYRSNETTYKRRK